MVCPAAGMATGQGQHLYPSWGPTLVSMKRRQGCPLGLVLSAVVDPVLVVGLMEQREEVGLGCSVEVAG